jgi:hypothetical protein
VWDEGRVKEDERDEEMWVWVMVTVRGRKRELGVEWVTNWEVVMLKMRAKTDFIGRGEKNEGLG